MMFIGQLVFHTSIAFLSIYTAEYLNETAKIYGFLEATISIGGIIAGILGTWRWRISKERLAIFAFLIVFMSLFVMSITPFLAGAFLGILLLGIGTTWIRVLLQSVQQMATHSAYHGRMASFRMVCNQGSVVISAPVIGWIATEYGVHLAYAALLIPVSIGLLISLYVRRQAQFQELTRTISC